MLDNLGKEQFADLIEGCLKTGDDLISKLIDLKEGGDIDDIVDRAHELKGMAANFGFTELSNIAGNIERAARDENQDAALLEIEKLPDANQSAKTAIQTWL